MLDFHRHRGVFLGSQAVTAPLACFSSDLISQRLCDTYARHAATPVLLTWDAMPRRASNRYACALRTMS